MNKPVFYIILILISSSRHGISQENLVRNGSFEDTVSKNYGVHYELCKHWYNASPGTVDYSTPHCIELLWEPWCAPNNLDLGYQVAKEGVAYAGLVLYERVFPDINPEIIQGELKEPLEAGVTYILKFYLNLADSCDFKTCNLDVFLENEQSLCSDCLPEIFPRFSIDITDVDSLHWHEKSVLFVAQGGERYIYFSNYMSALDAVNCEIDRGDWTKVHNAAYYFIDDVSIIKVDEALLENIDIPNVLTPNSDGVNDTFFIPNDKNGLTLKGVNYSILNRWGNLVFEGNEHTHWNGTDQSGNILPEGIYYYVIVQSNKNINLQKSGFVHLMR